MSQGPERSERGEHLERLQRERHASFADLAKEKRLESRRLPYSIIWIEQDQEDNRHYPTHFYSERYTGGKPELKEHNITFPVQDVASLGETVEALDALYMGTVNPVAYDRDSVEGFMRFVKEFAEDQTLKQLEENKK